MVLADPQRAIHLDGLPGQPDPSAEPAEGLLEHRAHQAEADVLAAHPQGLELHVHPTVGGGQVPWLQGIAALEREASGGQARDAAVEPDRVLVQLVLVEADVAGEVQPHRPPLHVPAGHGGPVPPGVAGIVSLVDVQDRERLAGLGGVVPVTDPDGPLHGQGDLVGVHAPATLEGQADHQRLRRGQVVEAPEVRGHRRTISGCGDVDPRPVVPFVQQVVDLDAESPGVGGGPVAPQGPGHAGAQAGPHAAVFEGGAPVQGGHVAPGEPQVAGVDHGEGQQQVREDDAEVLPLLEPEPGYRQRQADAGAPQPHPVQIHVRQGSPPDAVPQPAAAVHEAARCRFFRSDHPPRASSRGCCR